MVDAARGARAHAAPDDRPEFGRALGRDVPTEQMPGWLLGLARRCSCPCWRAEGRWATSGAAVRRGRLGVPREVGWRLTPVADGAAATVEWAKAAFGQSESRAQRVSTNLAPCAFGRRDAREVQSRARDASLERLGDVRSRSMHVARGDAPSREIEQLDAQAAARNVKRAVSARRERRFGPSDSARSAARGDGVTPVVGMPR